VRGLLYAGTERGAYVSSDDGGTWTRLGTGLPVVPVHDLAIHGDDLVAATHGRAFWILDDIGPVRQAAAGDAGGLRLFEPRPTPRLEAFWGWTAREGREGHLHMDNATATWTRPYPEGEGLEAPTHCLDAGDNPPNGVVLTYRLPEGLGADAVRLRILDAGGGVIRSFSSAEPAKEPLDDREAWHREPRLPARPGLNRFAWDMRYPGPEHLPKDVFWAGSRTGPLAPAGTYQAELRAGDETVRVSFEIVPDPRTGAARADLEARFDLAIRIRDTISEAHRALRTIHAVRAQAAAWVERTRGSVHADGVEAARKALDEALTPVEEALMQTRARHREDILNYPVRLNDKLASLMGAVEEGDFRPTDAMYALFDELAGQVAAQRRALAAALESRLGAVNDAVHAAGLKPMTADEVG
jgi:hypothetical protein